MTGRVRENLIEVRQGDSFIINVAVTEKNGTPKDLTDASLLMQVRKRNGDLVFSVEGVEVDVLNGRMNLLLTPEQTNNEVGEYITDIQLTTADGSVNTIFPGDVNKIATFKITEQVTVIGG